MSLSNKNQDQQPRPAPETGAEQAPSGLSRRDFMRVSGTVAAATAITASACKPPAETSVPHSIRPEGLRTPGKPKFYSTVLGGSPVLVRTREGRPILINSNPDHPSGRGLSLRQHAALLDLYDPDRATGPLSVRRGKGAPSEVDWKTVGQQVVSRIKAKKGDVVLLTEHLTGPGSQALVQELCRKLSIQHVSYDPLGDDSEAQAFTAAFGNRPMPRPQLDRAKLIVGFGAEFMDGPDDGLEIDFAKRRDPKGKMSRFIQLEGRLTLTGANADRRMMVRDSKLASVAAAVAHEIIVVHRKGPLAGDPAVSKTLAQYKAKRVAESLANVNERDITDLARQLVAARGRSVVLAGGSASACSTGFSLELAVLLINDSLGNYQKTFAPAARPQRPSGMEQLAKLVADIKAKKVGTLIIAGPNPVYNTPAQLGFAAALGAVDFIVSLNDRIDETSALADYLAPASHALESWADCDLGNQLLALQQPVIRPLYNSHGLTDILVAWAANAGAGGAIAEAARMSLPAKADSQEPVLSGGYHYLRNHWLNKILSSKSQWDETLRSGYHKYQPDLLDSQASVTPEAAENPASSQPAASQPAASQPAASDASAGEPATAQPATPAAPADTTLRFDPAAVHKLQPKTATPQLELQLYPDFALADGKQGNNGWLHEFPDPVTRISWGGAVSIAPRRFDELGLSNGDWVELTVDKTRLTLPAYRHAGMHMNQIALPLGLGRDRVGQIGSNVGYNAFGLQQLTGKHLLRSGLTVTMTKANGHSELALGQGGDVLDRARRQLLPVATLEEYQKDPSAGTFQTPGGPSAWPEHPYEGQRWEMAIDLSKCNGCGKCTIACQAENNIPIVGKQGIIDGREMSWIRIDRYYDAPKKEGGWGDEVWEAPLDVVENPTTLFEPMLCQHCENAPCETVCPFNATMHSADGLNQQIYNRCVGTRYCANNCPFKVRRYNWFEYSQARTSAIFTTLFPELKEHAAMNTRGQMQMKNNPEVTVRSRGVMEKCSFCVQRIREAGAEAIRQGHKGAIPDAAVVPACMEACPTGAIVFGDSNNPKTRVAKLIKDPRAIRLLESTGVKPSISYLTRVRNDNA